MITKSNKHKPWLSPTDTEGFQKIVTDLLEETNMKQDIDHLNDSIVAVVLEGKEIRRLKDEKSVKRPDN